MADKQMADEAHDARAEMIAQTLLLADTIGAWHDMACESGETVPDFWDECSTSERLAEFLISNGWVRKA